MDSRYPFLVDLIKSTKTIPEDLFPWDWERTSGRNSPPIGHVIGMFCKLSRDFTRWDWADETGRTIAHVAASNGNLPDDFDRWDLVDGQGQTVREVFQKYFFVNLERRKRNAA